MTKSKDKRTSDEDSTQRRTNEASSFDNSTKIDGNNNFVVNPHTIGRDMYVYSKARRTRSRKTKITLSVSGVTILAVASVIGWTVYRNSATQAPFTVAVEPLTPMCGTGWIVPLEPAKVNIATLQNINSFPHGWRDWPDGRGGAAASGNGYGGHLQLSVQGRSQTQVVLTDITVRTTERRPPISGTLLERGCGDQWAFRWLDVNLDKEPPQAKPTFSPGAYLPDSPSFENKPIAFPYRVAETDAETFVLDANTATCDCLWVVDIHWSSAGESGILTVDDHGKPFRTSSTSNATQCEVTDHLECT